MKSKKTDEKAVVKRKTPLKKVAEKEIVPVIPESAEVKEAKQGKMPDIDPEIGALIKDAFSRFYTADFIKTNKNKEVNHLNNIMSEYLKAYMVIGYDLNDDKIFLMRASSIKDRDALIENLRLTSFNISNQQVNGGDEEENLDEE